MAEELTPNSEIPEPYVLPHMSPAAELPKTEDQAGPGESYAAGYSPSRTGSWVSELVVKPR